MNQNSTQRKTAFLCYDHLSGILGEMLFQNLIDKNWIIKSKKGRDYDITEMGFQGLASLGIERKKIVSTKRKILSPCIERKGNIYFEHTGAYLGSLLTERFLELNWLNKGSDKELVLTNDGMKEFNNLGIKIK